MTATRRSTLSEKGGTAMETNADGTYFQERDHVRVKRTGETGRVNAADGGVVYVVMDGTNETRVFSAFVEEDATIELVIPAGTTIDAG
ncbi:MAG: hypothetical protein WCD86_21790 [Ktedonobacteraceae bacterium]